MAPLKHIIDHKYQLIKQILKLSKLSNEFYGTELLNESELYKLKRNDLRNVLTELKVQLDITTKNIRY